MHYQCERCCARWDRCGHNDKITYSVAQPVFVLVPIVAVVHVHAFALDGQSLLKEDAGS